MTKTPKVDRTTRVLLLDLSYLEETLERLTPGTQAHAAVAERVVRLATFLGVARPARLYRSSSSSSPLVVTYEY